MKVELSLTTIQLMFFTMNHIVGYTVAVALNRGVVVSHCQECNTIATEITYQLSISLVSFHYVLVSAVNVSFYWSNYFLLMMKFYIWTSI